MWDILAKSVVEKLQLHTYKSAGGRLKLDTHKSAGGRSELNFHTHLTQRSQRGLTMLSTGIVWEPLGEMSSLATRQETLVHCHLSSLRLKLLTATQAPSVRTNAETTTLILQSAEIQHTVT